MGFPTSWRRILAINTLYMMILEASRWLTWFRSWCHTKESVLTSAAFQLQHFEEIECKILSRPNLSTCECDQLFMLRPKKQRNSLQPTGEHCGADIPTIDWAGKVTTGAIEEADVAKRAWRFPVVTVGQHLLNQHNTGQFIEDICCIDCLAGFFYHCCSSQVWPCHRQVVFPCKLERCQSPSSRGRQSLLKNSMATARSRVLETHSAWWRSNRLVKVSQRYTSTALLQIQGYLFEGLETSRFASHKTFLGDEFAHLKKDSVQLRPSSTICRGQQFEKN